MNVLVLGLGRTGLPQALTLAKSGHTVIGLDSDASLIEQIKSNKAPFWEPKIDRLLSETLNDGSFLPVADEEFAVDSLSLEAIVISIGAPVNGTPESFVQTIAYV